MAVSYELEKSYRPIRSPPIPCMRFPKPARVCPTSQFTGYLVGDGRESREITRGAAYCEGVRGRWRGRRRPGRTRLHYPVWRTHMALPSAPAVRETARPRRGSKVRSCADSCARVRRLSVGEGPSCARDGDDAVQRWITCPGLSLSLGCGAFLQPPRTLAGTMRTRLVSTKLKSGDGGIPDAVRAGAKCPSAGSRSAAGPAAFPTAPTCDPRACPAGLAPPIKRGGTYRYRARDWVGTGQAVSGGRSVFYE